ncbi:isocitrate lyase/PEP mutase family protein [Streptomyces flavofungini]|uniref:Isocitrate lyase/phosphoenolpyruvate mutase family protein n=1 Tax=Streptomyces flavofungini TaxID=68200 RepID=A0ABS0XAT3_9ACTN|nr:isocitrate lyase/phosphoenolpyruvate mutase family protein [Streptomyces flavofungini]MBJ3810325.1 isocitrate lyase/phosphoenolpyruvate mutase family protein [Streptomyces flavofungini]MBJ3811949.1 isocitrate lyase/phosphoenolpyruvate mutase family protein [Streptomyces flavofungini]GHC50943.1 phosphonomutase [Streptomyces flavofungini]
MTEPRTERTPDRSDRFEAFRALHRTGDPLLLPNAWDHASAAALARAGFPAIGTTSLGVAAAAGKPDATGAARAETLSLALGLARLPALITVDIEGGFSERPADVAELARELAAAGVVGVNLEDGRPDGTLTAVGPQCELIRAVKEAVPALFLNARTDAYWLNAGGEKEARERAAAYQLAGADGVFVPGVQDEAAIAGLVAALDVPLNILYAPGGRTPERLAALGVRRVSSGSLLFRAAVRHAVEVAQAFTRGAVGPEGLPTYAEAQELAADFGDDREVP